MKIDGKQIAQDILNNLKQRVEKLERENITPCLAIILVGKDPASIAYIKQKELKAKSIGIKTITYNLKSEIKNQELIKLIKKLNKDKSIHGIVTQQPLSKYINTETITQIINPKKDVDGFHSKSHFEMPIALAALKILKEIHDLIPNVEPEFIEWLKNKKIVVIGKGETGGKPIIITLKKLDINLLIIDSKTRNPSAITKTAEIIITAVGKPKILTSKMIKKKVILIDVGISKGKDAKAIGDYAENEIKNIASFYTPTPGGIGPVNVAMLLQNTVIAAGK